MTKQESEIVSVECPARGAKGPFKARLFIGNPRNGNGPADNQIKYLESNGIQLHPKFLQDIKDLGKLAEELGVSASSLMKKFKEDQLQAKKTQKTISESNSEIEKQTLEMEAKFERLPEFSQEEEPITIKGESHER